MFRFLQVIVLCSFVISVQCQTGKNDNNFNLKDLASNFIKPLNEENEHIKVNMKSLTNIIVNELYKRYINETELQTNLKILQNEIKSDVKIYMKDFIKNITAEQLGSISNEIENHIIQPIAIKVRTEINKYINYFIVLYTLLQTSMIIIIYKLYKMNTHYCNDKKK